MDVTLLVLAAFTTLLLTGLFIDFAMGHGRVRALKDIGPAQSGPPLSIIAAARNEARGIEAAVTSLLRLDYPALEIVIVNDRSTDETGAILERLSNVVSSGFSRHSPSKIVTITELPDGWLGKNYALQVGADSATGDLILFTDADIVFEPTTLRRAVALLEMQHTDHLAVIPDIDVPGVALNAFVAAFAVFFSMYARPWKVRDPRSSAHIGVGAFNLIRREVYRAIGGHRAIAMRPDDDIKLGKLVKKHGFRQDVAVGRDLITVEWYASIGELVDGLMKNAFAGVDYSLWKVAGSSARAVSHERLAGPCGLPYGGRHPRAQRGKPVADRADLLDCQRHARGVCAGLPCRRGLVHLHHVAIGADRGHSRHDRVAGNRVSVSSDARQSRVK